ncbi:hypothetical protein GGF40_003291 [Coemansia sp. RSA 1286]|nr:hypothetical protein GGF40_003291 [Coemansia sp. RSA 1286]
MFPQQNRHNTNTVGSVGTGGNANNRQQSGYPDNLEPPLLSHAGGEGKRAHADLREERPLSIQSLLNGRVSLSPPPRQPSQQPQSQSHVQQQSRGSEKAVHGADLASPLNSYAYTGYVPRRQHQVQQQHHIYQGASPSSRHFISDPHYPHGANGHSLVYRNGPGYQSAPMAPPSSSSSSLDIRYRPYPEIHSVGPQPPAGVPPQTPHQQMHPPQLVQRVSDNAIGKLPLYARITGGLSKEEKRTAKRGGHSDQLTLQQQQQRRRRRTQACEYCHLKKIKCEGDGVRCINCVKNDVQCTWGLKRKRGPKPKVGVVTDIVSVAISRAKSHQRQKQQPRSSAARVQIAEDKQPLGEKMPLGQPEHQAGHLTAASVPTAAPITPTTAVEAEEAAPVSSQVPIAMILRSESTEPSVSPAQISIDDIQSDDESSALSPPSSDTFEGLRAPAMDGVLNEFFSDKFDADTRDTVRYYFDYFYPLCPMFHPSMFIRRVVRGEVDPLLLDAMRAASAKVITRMTGRFVDGAAIAKSVKQRIILQLEQPSVDLVRVLVIMTLLAGSQGEYMSYNSLICLAASIVVRMGWHKLDLYKRPPPASWESWVNLEVKRRVFWLVYQTDSYQAMLTGRPMSIDEDTVYVQAPCSDYEWDVIVHSPENAASPMDKLATAATSALVAGSIDQSTIVATGAFSYSFMALCELTAIIAHINTFLCDAKAGRSRLPQPAMGSEAPGSSSTSASFPREGPFPAVEFLGTPHSTTTGDLVHPVERTVTLLSEYPTYVALDTRLEAWKGKLLMPEDLRDDAMEANDISYFGTADHRRFMMRVRYFCLHCYYVPITIFLHQSNRPSFFTEYEQPLEARLRRSKNGQGEAASDSAANDCRGAQTSAEDEESDMALREMLNMAFASTWNEGLLAYDIEQQSWKMCVQAAHGLSEHLERNSDFPLYRFDQIIPFCIFMSVSVLIRQIRSCNKALAKGTGIGLLRSVAEVEVERNLCVKHIRHQWELLQSLGSLWDVQGMQLLLKSMQIDEVANAADMLSGMSLSI